MNILGNSLTVVLFAGGMLYLGYKAYGSLLMRRVFKVDDANETPAVTYRDGIDYVPTHPAVLFGHHFASIAGLGPIIGPAIAVYWGWVPALLWVLLACVLVGGVHDLAALYVSIRHRARTIGDLTNDIVGPRARVLFLLIIFFLLALAMGVFALNMAKLFNDLSPQAVVPTFLLILIAMVIGTLVYRRRWRLGPITVIGVVVMVLATVGGLQVPVPLYRAFITDPKVKEIIETTDDPDMPHVHGIRATRADKTLHYFQTRGETDPAYAAMAEDVRRAGERSRSAWVYTLLFYAFVASVLPVWFLLQPRDYINSYQLYIGLLLLVVGIVVWRPAIVAPAFGAVEPLNAAEAPGPLPLLFVTIACGAVSGFHNLVSSGTTARQLRRESDARVIGYGAMLVEGLLAVLVILACTAGLGAEGFRDKYGEWARVGNGALGAFLQGAANVIAAPFKAVIPEANHAAATAFSLNFIAVVVVSFAMTTLDSATRLLRYNVEAIGKLSRVKPFENRYVASAVAVAAIGYFALMKIGGRPAGLALWQLFGTTNQLLAALGLMVATIYLYQIGRPILYTLLPMLLMLGSVTWAMSINLTGYYRRWIDTGDPGSRSLFIVGSALMLMTVWMVIEAVVAYRRGRQFVGN